MSASHKSLQLVDINWVLSLCSTSVVPILFASVASFYPCSLFLSLSLLSPLWYIWCPVLLLIFCIYPTVATLLNLNHMAVRVIMLTSLGGDNTPLGYLVVHIHTSAHTQTQIESGQTVRNLSVAIGTWPEA